MHAYVAPNSRLGKETLHAVFSPFDVFSAESCNQSSDHLCVWLRGTHILLESFDAEENVACTILDREADEAHGVCLEALDIFVQLLHGLGAQEIALQENVPLALFEEALQWLTRGRGGRRDLKFRSRKMWKKKCS
jgi:hypothetical protein